VVADAVDRWWRITLTIKTLAPSRITLTPLERRQRQTCNPGRSNGSAINVCLGNVRRIQ